MLLYLIINVVQESLWQNITEKLSRLYHGILDLILVGVQLANFALVNTKLGKLAVFFHHHGILTSIISLLYLLAICPINIYVILNFGGFGGS